MGRPAVIQNDKLHVSHDTLLANVCRYLTQ